MTLHVIHLLVHIEGLHGLTHHETLDGVAHGTGDAARSDALVLGGVIGRQLRDHVLVVSHVETDLPEQVLLLERDVGQVQFDALVLQGADVGHQFVPEVGAGRNRGLVKQVRGLPVIHVQVRSQTVVPEAQVHTRVIGRGGLPLQVGVVALRRNRDDPAVAEVVHTGILTEDVGRQGRIVARIDFLLAGLAPGETQLQGAQGRVQIAHEAFLHDVPAECHGREDTPLVVLETGGTVRTDRSRQQVFVCEGVVGTAEEGDQEEFAPADRVTQHGLVADTVGITLAFAVEVLPGITGHQVDVVLTEGLVPVAVEFEGGVATAIGVVGMLATAGLVRVVVGSFGAHGQFGDTGTLGPVDTEVEVEAEGFKAVDLVVELRVADETVGIGRIVFRLEQAHRVHRGHRVDVAGLVIPGGEAVQVVAADAVAHRFGRVVVVGGADGILVRILVEGIGAFTVEVDRQVLVEETRREVDGGRGTVHLRALERTRLGRITAGYTVREDFADAAGDAQVAVVGRGDLVDLTLPVGVVDLLLAALIDTEVGFGSRVLAVEFTDQVGDPLGVEQAVVLGDRVHGTGEVSGHVRHVAAGLGALLRGDHDDTVGCTGTVDGGGRSIFQHGEALDVFRVDGRKRIGHTADAVVRHRQTVNHDERVVGRIEGGAATDTDRRTGTRHTGTGGDDHTGALATQEVSRRRDDTLVDFVSLDGRNRAGHVALLDRTVTDDDHFVQEFLVILEEDASSLSGFDRNGLQTQEADFDKRAGGRYCKTPLSVDVRLHAVAGTHLDHSSPDHRAEFVLHDAFGRILRKGCGGGQRQDREQNKNLLH